jgi:hypothetical protein
VRRRKAVAILAVLVLAVVALPVLFTLFARSSTAVRWLVKLQNLKLAIARAQEAEGEALELIRARSTVRAGNRSLTGGGFEFRIRSLGTGDGGQWVYAVAAEGASMGEERMVVSLVDATGTDATRLLVPRDRAWGPALGSGPLPPMTFVLKAHNDRVENYQAVLFDESRMDASVFLEEIKARVLALKCPDLEREWPTIAQGIAAAKTPPVND